MARVRIAAAAAASESEARAPSKSCARETDDVHSKNGDDRPRLSSRAMRAKTLHEACCRRVLSDRAPWGAANVVMVMPGTASGARAPATSPRRSSSTHRCTACAAALRSNDA